MLIMRNNTVALRKSIGLFKNLAANEVNDTDKVIKDALDYLIEYGINTAENREAIYTFPTYSLRIAIALNTLKRHGVLTEQNRLRICAHAEYSTGLALAIGVLYESNIYTLPNWILLAKLSEKALAIAFSFKSLLTSGLYTESNKVNILTIYSNLEYPDAMNLSYSLSSVSNHGNLTQENFDKLCADPEDAWDIEHSINNKILSKHNH